MSPRSASSPARWYADQRVELIFGHRATGFDEKQRRVRVDDGQELAYDALLLVEARGAVAEDQLHPLVRVPTRGLKPISDSCVFPESRPFESGGRS